jgi:PAS domain S-box-containing protein
MTAKGHSDAVPGRIIGTGEMADRVRAYDWSSTPLGPIDAWSTELLTIVNLTLCSPSPARTMWGPDFILIYNDAYRPIPGPRHPSALGKPAKAVYGESWHVVGPLLEKAFATGETLFYEKLLVPLPTLSGVQDFYLNYSFNPIYEGSRIAGLFGPLHDVTGEVIATRKLEESEARATRILRSIGDAVIVTDANGCITRMNPIAEALTGWTHEEATGHPLTAVFRVVSEETGEVVESPVQKVKRLGTVVGLANHTILKAKDGREIHIDDSGAPIRNDDGELTGIVLVFRDINERRAAERERDRVTKALQEAAEALQASDEELRWTIELSPQIPWTADAEGRIVGFSDSWLELTGLTREQALGDGWLQAPHPDDAPNIAKTWKHALLTGERYQVEHRIRTSNGQYRWMRSSALPRHDPEGKIVKWYGTTEDIEEHKRAERALMQSEKLAAVGRLASSIAHEINNPLEAVTNLIYLARQKALLPEVLEYLQTAEQELRRVSAIANQTLRFHRQSTNRQSIRCSELITSVLSIFQGRFVNANITVELRNRGEESLKCFEGEIRQVFSNLVANAIDAMQPHGGKLLLRSRKATQWKTGCRGVAFTVADTGSGMDQQTLQRIFEAFFTTKDISGTGLGLWISKDIVERHRGQLRVRSSQRLPRCGTVFVLFLPMDVESRAGN